MLRQSNAAHPPIDRPVVLGFLVLPETTAQKKGQPFFELASESMRKFVERLNASYSYPSYAAAYFLQAGTP
jgi:hypothetical protein